MVVHYKMLTAQTGQALLRPVQFVASYLVQTKEYILDTTSWKPGVYIIRAYIDGKPYTAKISVK
jgi:hypothetical protein